jgi:flagellar hook-basal body complex protein FliE
MDFAGQFQAQTMPGYGKIPGLPTMPSQPGLEGHVVKSDQVGGKSFGETIGMLVNRANETMAVPENLSIQAVQTGNVDIHEVMIALGKSEVAFKLITSISQKVIGAFDKLTSLQV